MSAPRRPAATVDDGLVDEWRALQSRHAALSCALDKALQARHELGLSDFETLDRLVDANCGQYRMAELARDSHLTQSALSRAVARLEREGLVHRSVCDNDRRSVFVCLTDKGRELHAAALPTHREVLEQTWQACDA